MYYHVHINKKKYLLSILIFLFIMLLGFLYTVFQPSLSEKLPLLLPDCMFKQLFHLYCPGCGGTRALGALFKLNLFQSFCYHPIVIYVVFWLSFFYIKIGIQIKKQNGIADVNISLAPLWGALIIIVTFFIIRNLALVFAGIDYIGELVSFWK